MGRALDMRSLFKSTQGKGGEEMNFIERCLADKDTLIINCMGKLLTTVTKTGEIQVRILKCFVNLNEEPLWIDL